MQTLRKKTSPLKYKNETTKFLGDGVSFKAKLIGILEVSEARGDRMCQEALSDLKMAIRAAGEHKQRITVNIAIDGLRLRDEKTGDCLYHHPVHKISFIAQDMTDSRAFGYIFGSPDTGHRFFGIKTDKAASQVVIAMRDLFQVVFSLKKKEIELAKQHLEKTYLPQSPLFSETSAPPKVSEKSRTDIKGLPSTSETKTSGTAVADLVDLELALNNLQQGLSQMEKITPSNPYGSKDDPFGDSFVYPSVNSQPILPPPPSSGRERSRTSETSSIFSPKMLHRSALSSDDPKESPASHTKELKELNEHFAFPREFSASVTSTDRSLSDDWFAAADKFEEPLVPPDQPRDEKHAQAKLEIMSQFDVFTELDPLELKNPPKKALNELASSISANQELFSGSCGSNSIPVDGGKHFQFNNDPFGEDPFVKEDPFANSDFSKQDPFHSELVNFPTTHITNNLEKGLPTNNPILSKSPKLTPLDKESSSVSPRSYFGGTRGVESNFDKKLHDIPSNLDISSGSESTPEPPPRPVSTLTETRPPPLPPKKVNDILIKPPPRPPYTEDTRYDFVVGASEPVHKEITSEAEKAPALPLPLRKSKFESDFISYPDRSAKKLPTLSSDEDYLTPISFPPKPNNCDINIPPPQRSAKKEVTKSTNSINNPIEGLDVSLSQLTLNGLNELAVKLNIPSSQLSNMTLAQLASYISTFIKDKANEQEKLHEQSKTNEFPKFEADFSAFNNTTITVGATSTASSSTYDKYAVFRELQEEINQISKTEPQVQPKQEDSSEDNKFEDKFEDSIQDLDLESNEVKKESNADDKYAALREIVEKEMQGDTFKQNKSIPSVSQNPSDGLNIQDLKNSLVDNNNTEPNLRAITPINELQPKEKDVVAISLDKSKSPNISPARSPVLKSPRSPSVLQEIAGSARLTSGSLSDIVSGSSPEVDNTGSNSDNARKGTNTDLGESWAVFDSNAPPSESLKENLCAVQSEEGVSPWSSDSKEFGNSSPVEWKKDGDEQWKSKKKQDGWWDTSAEPEVVGFYNPSNRRSTDSYEEEYYECYERPRRPRRQWQHGAHQPAGGHSSSSRDVSPWEEEPNRREGWQRHSKESFERHRDRRTDSWDEEDDCEYDEGRTRGHYFERRSSRDSERQSSGGSRDMDSERWTEGWNDERRHRRRREGPREMTRGEMTDKDRWCCVDWKRSERERPERDRPERDRSERERPERDRPERERPERDRAERDIDKSRRYPRKPTSDRRGDRHEDRYRTPRESQESPWEDEYDPESRHFLSVGNRKNWKQRPSSASEMERKSAELKARGHLGTVGSDGEKERRYKGARRSRSRDSHYTERPARHKPETLSTRNQYRTKQYGHSRTLDFDYGEVGPKKQIPEGTASLKKTTPSKDRPKKSKDESPRDGSSKSITSTSLPRKTTDRSKSMFEADYEPTKDSPSPSQWEGGKFDFEVEFLPEIGSVIAHKKDPPNLPDEWQAFLNPPTDLEKEEEDLKLGKPPFYKDQRSLLRQQKSRSPFEDDFSPSEKMMDGNGISSIKEETDVAEDTEDDTRFSSPKLPEPQRKTAAAPKHRLSSGGGGRTNVNLSKSESVNIFSMENDPFDDEFFSQPPDEMKSSTGRADVDYSWTDRFQEYGTRRK